MNKGLPFLRTSLLLLVGIALILCTGCSDDDPPTKSGDPAGYTNASGINGGRMFDKFWATETGWSQSDPNLATFNAYADFFRCKQCHGWDRLGNKGAYISRGPKTTRPNVSSVDLRSVAASNSPQEMFDKLMKSTGRRSISADLSTYDPNSNSTVGDQMPNFSSILTEAQAWDLVRYLKDAAIDVGNLYDHQTSGSYPTGSITYSNIGKDGSATNGDAIFAARCTGCHGTDGTQILVDGDEFTVGSFIRHKPNEAQHKIKFGQLGTGMTSLVTSSTEMKDLYKALTDESKYPDPEAP